jgi:hypothetical protein
MAKKTKRRTKRVSWTKSHLAELRKYSRDKLPLKKISRLMKRSGRFAQQKVISALPPNADMRGATRESAQGQ